MKPARARLLMACILAGLATLQTACSSSRSRATSLNDQPAPARARGLCVQADSIARTALVHVEAGAQTAAADAD